MSVKNLTVDQAKEKGFKIVDTNRVKNGLPNDKDFIMVEAIVDNLYLKKGKKYRTHKMNAEKLVAKKVVKIVKED